MVMRNISPPFPSVIKVIGANTVFESYKKFLWRKNPLRGVTYFLSYLQYVHTVNYICTCRLARSGGGKGSSVRAGSVVAARTERL
jgi:hypothetical protein